MPGFSTYRRFLRMLKTNGYKYDCRVINAKHYGVPQNRRRLILLAVRYRQISLPEPKYGKQLRPFMTVRQAISHFPPIAAGKCHLDIPNHVAASISELNLKRLRRTPHDGGDRRAWPESLRLECHTGNYKGHTDVYGRMQWDRPAPAPDEGVATVFPTGDTGIRFRTGRYPCAKPPPYSLFPTHTSSSVPTATSPRQIGNAVPVRLSERIGKHILSNVDTPGNT